MLVLEIAQNSVEVHVIEASREGKGSVLLFDRMIDMWPNCSVEVEQPGRRTGPPLGYCWYSAKSWPNVYKENWERSI